MILYKTDLCSLQGNLFLADWRPVRIQPPPSEFGTEQNILTHTHTHTQTPKNNNSKKKKTKNMKNKNEEREKRTTWKDKYSDNRGRMGLADKLSGSETTDGL